MNRPFAWLLLAALALAALLWFALVPREAEPVIEAVPPEATLAAPTPSTPAGDPPAAATPVAASAPAVSAKPEPPPLPPPQTPVAEIYDELAARALAGDARAACRLGSELLRCRQAADSESMTEGLVATLEQSKERPSDGVVDLLAAMEESKRATAPLCVGITAGQQAEASRFLRLAAERGNERMRLAYAVDPGLDSSNFLPDLEEWQHYRDVALDYLLAALHAGDPLAPHFLALVHAPTWPLAQGMPLRLPDAQKYYSYLALARRLDPEMHAEEPRGLLGVVPESIRAGVDMQAAEAEAARMQAAWYAARPASRPGELQAEAAALRSYDPALACDD